MYKNLYLVDPTPELQLRQSLIASAKSKVDRISVDGKRLVGQKEWDLLQQQVCKICKFLFILMVTDFS